MVVANRLFVEYYPYKDDKIKGIYLFLKVIYCFFISGYKEEIGIINFNVFEGLL